MVILPDLSLSCWARRLGGYGHFAAETLTSSFCEPSMSAQTRRLGLHAVPQQSYHDRTRLRQLFERLSREATSRKTNPSTHLTHRAVDLIPFRVRQSRLTRACGCGTQDVGARMQAQEAESRASPLPRRFNDYAGANQLLCRGFRLLC